MKNERYNDLGRILLGVGGLLGEMDFTLSFSEEDHFMAIIDNETKEVVNCLPLLDALAPRSTKHIVNEEVKIVEMEVSLKK